MVEETTNFGFSSGLDDSGVDEGGRVEGSGLYVYGRVMGLGRLMKGETVRGI